MNKNTVRLNITLPIKIAQELEDVVGPRKRSRFITEAIKLKIEQRQKEKLEKILEEGYLANKQESIILANEFEISDLEDWDEY